MKYIAVIPARGGSKGIPLKNIYPINGKPLISYTLEMLECASLENVDVVVSTDSREIREIARSYNSVFVVDRPDSISGDTASSEDALLHAIDEMERKNDIVYDAVLTLQPTSPLRKIDTLVEFIQTFQEKSKCFDAMLSLNETRSDYWIKTDSSKYERLYKDAPRRRQDRKPIYVENSAYYATLVAALRETRSVLGHRATGYIISDIEGIDINEPIDVLIAEQIIKTSFFSPMA